MFLIPSKKKHPLLMYNKYTYSSTPARSGGKVNWRCSRGTKIGCKAMIRANSEKIKDGVVNINDEHNHSPPNYHQTSNGTWVKL